jgi:hypothetical protein
MAGRSDSLRFGIGRASLSGPKSKQARVRAGANRFVTALRQSGLGVSKWENISNRHFREVVEKMKSEDIGFGRVGEVLAAARHVCRAYGNDRVTDSNTVFGVRRESICNQISRAVDPEKINQVIHHLEHNDQYFHAPRAAAQIRLQHELGLRREEAAKVDLKNDWNRAEHTLLIQYGSKGGRPRLLTDLSAQQEQALELALPYVSPSDRDGIYNLMPHGMGDRWQQCLSYAAKKNGLTKKDCGYTLHGNRHEHFRKVYAENTGFQPPNCFPSMEAFQVAAQEVAGNDWRSMDAEARNKIEVLAGHSAGRRDVSSAYLGRSF